MKPVALLIYANTGNALTYLEGECNAIAKCLEDSEHCEVEVVAAATLSDVVSKINDPALRDRIVLVHYAGHASGKGLQLRSEDGHVEGALAYVRGLAGVLKQQPHLRLFFINGCASREQVLELTQAGIPLIIATNQGIDDKVARDFADRFYRTLMQERSIGDAFQVATDTIRATVGQATRALYFGEFKQTEFARNNELPWEIHGPVVDRQWTLKSPYYQDVRNSTRQNANRVPAQVNVKGRVTGQNVVLGGVQIVSGDLSISSTSEPSSSSDATSIKHLITQFTTYLSAAPSLDPIDVQTVGLATEAILRELANPQPDRTRLISLGESFRRTVVTLNIEDDALVELASWISSKLIEEG